MRSTVFVGEQYGPAFDSVCTMLALIPVDVLERAAQKVDEVDIVGPLLDPTAWMDLPKGSTKQWKELFEHLAMASEILHREKRPARQEL